MGELGAVIEQILELLGSLHERGATLVMVTHDVGVARTAERVIHMLDGKILREERRGADGTFAEVEVAADAPPTVNE